MTIRRDRLQTLVERLRRVPRSKFDLGTWGTAGKVNGPVGEGGEKIAWCGTSGCAIGWAGTIKSFNKDGFFTVIDASGDGILYPYFNGLYSFTAVRQFFEISLYVAEKLFDPSEYIRGSRTPVSEVIDRIELLLVADEDTFREMVAQ